MKKINPCLWFDDQAEEAVKFYASLFKNSRIGRKVNYGKAAAEASGNKIGGLMTIEFELEGLPILGLNGGPHFKQSPAMSLFVCCDNDAEIEKLWGALSQGGETRMALDKYPWAPRYGWIADRYGLNWQLIIPSEKPREKIVPSFLFVRENFGKGEEAVNFYLSLFKNSKIVMMARDPQTKTVMHSRFELAGQEFTLMEGQGEHDFEFNPSFSLIVNCENQQEIDHFWSKMSAHKEAEQCGWLADKFGVSWQIVPANLGDMLTQNPPEKAEKITAAIMKMKKIELNQLK